MSTAQYEASVSSEQLLQEVSRLNGPALDKFLDQVLLLRAERRAPHLSKKETELFEVINHRRSPEAQAHFDFLIKRRRANKITSEELADLNTMTNQSEMQAAERVRAVSELADIRKLTFDEMWQQLGL